MVNPDCCDEMRKFKTIRLDDGDMIYGNALEPHWIISYYEEKHECYSVTPIKDGFCPHCATPIPGIKKIQVKGTVCKVTDGGYYCDTCEERLHACKCDHAPAEEWAPDK